MNNKNRLFTAVDIMLLILMIIPIAAGIFIKVVTTPETAGIVITGARIFFTVKLPVQDLPITESQVNSWLVMLSIFWLCIYLTHGLKVKAQTRRQLVAEWIVEKVDKMVCGNMGGYFKSYGPFIASIIILSAFSSLITLCGLYPPTSDINVVAGWAVLVFCLITFYRSKCGPFHYIKSFGEPVALLAPLNIISEVATPVSMAFRHYGNILSGSVISVLVAAGLQGLSALLLGWLPGTLGSIPLLQIGLPAILSVYFDVFSGCLQAYIFAMLTMMYVSGAFPTELFFARKEKRRKKTEMVKK